VVVTFTEFQLSIVLLDAFPNSVGRPEIKRAPLYKIQASERDVVLVNWHECVGSDADDVIAHRLRRSVAAAREVKIQVVCQINDRRHVRLGTEMECQCHSVIASFLELVFHRDC